MCDDDVIVCNDESLCVTMMSLCVTMMFVIVCNDDHCVFPTVTMMSHGCSPLSPSERNSVITLHLHLKCCCCVRSDDVSGEEHKACLCLMCCSFVVSPLQKKTHTHGELSSVITAPSTHFAIRYVQHFICHFYFSNIFPAIRRR